MSQHLPDGHALIGAISCWNWQNRDSRGSGLYPDGLRIRPRPVPAPPAASVGVHAWPDPHAVDRILRFMEVAPIDPRFRREVEAFLIVTGTSPTVFGRRAIGRSSFMLELGSGMSPTLDIVKRVRSWMHGAADDFQRRGIAWLLASEVTVPPCGLGAAFAPWTEDGARIRKLDGATFLPEREAAAVVGLSHRTPTRYRATGGGPAFHKFGSKVLYARFDLEAWIEARLRRRRLTVRPLRQAGGGWSSRPGLRPSGPRCAIALSRNAASAGCCSGPVTPAGRPARTAAGTRCSFPATSRERRPGRRSSASGAAAAMPPGAPCS